MIEKKKTCVNKIENCLSFSRLIKFYLSLSNHTWNHVINLIYYMLRWKYLMIRKFHGNVTSFNVAIQFWFSPTHTIYAKKFTIFEIYNACAPYQKYPKERTMKFIFRIHFFSIYKYFICCGVEIYFYNKNKKIKIPSIRIF